MNKAKSKIGIILTLSFLLAIFFFLSNLAYAVITVDEDTFSYSADPAFFSPTVVCDTGVPESGPGWETIFCGGPLYYKFDSYAGPSNYDDSYIYGDHWGSTWACSSSCLTTACIDSYWVNIGPISHNLSPGEHTIYFYVTCDVGARAWNEYFEVVVTETAPTIFLYSPPNNTWVNYIPTFKAEIFDDNFPDQDARAYFEINAVSNWGNYVNNNGGLSKYTPASLADGSWWWRAYARDTTGRESDWTNYWLIKKDTVNPTATINQENPILYKI